MSDGRDPRGHFYIFEHIALPQLFYSDPARFLSQLAYEGDRFLAGFWDFVGTKLDPPDHPLDGAGLHGEVRLLDHNVQAALITPPAPQKVTEAYFIAALYSPDFGGGSLARYLTLEYGWNPMTDSAYTVFCGWQGPPSIAHYNMGAGPEPELEVFVARVQSLLDAPAPGAHS